jgi:hypothetical protein
VCPGCGLALPPGGRRFDDVPTASPECWELYGELSARIVTDQSLQRFQQLRVDAYFAQHPGPRTADLSIAFALMGLLLVVGRGASGTEVRAFHQRLGNARISWPHLDPPADRGPITVFDVALATSSGDCAERVRRWAGSVWRAWADHHATVEGWMLRYGR